MPSMKPASGTGLLRQLGFFSATALVISNMIGTGIFATTGFMAGQLGSARLILACWAVGAVFAFAGCGPEKIWIVPLFIRAEIARAAAFAVVSLRLAMLPINRSFSAPQTRPR